MCIRKFYHGYPCRKRNRLTNKMSTQRDLFRRRDHHLPPVWSYVSGLVKIKINTMNTHQKFLEFNGKNIVFLKVDGSYWIALKPILDALKMDADRSIKTLKNDPILGPERSIQPVQVSKNGKKQLRNMTCLPEKFIYGWIFSLRSESKELIEYKKTCYNLLYNHFHGTIINRKELLVRRSDVITEIYNLKKSLKDNDASYKKLQKLVQERKAISAQLNSMDSKIVKDPKMF